MNIQPINVFNHYRTQNSLTKNSKNARRPTNTNINSGLALSPYTDYNISFKARLNRTPENFYAQKFNIDNMPVTVKKYLFEDFEERRHMPPSQLQRQAFEYLQIADNVQDIKDMYPDEPLFAHLKEISDIKPNQGPLLLLKWDAQTYQTPIFKDKQNKSLSAYLLKKVYLEGKTIEELNKDFDNDATDAIKKELGVKDKQYFSYTNIHTLGIRYPKLPYYNSFLATRNDKEYVPLVRKSAVPVSQETKEKLSASMTKWWAGLNEMERAEQIKKMLNGKDMSNSIFSKYQGQIMTIAAAQMGFSEKLSDIFAEKYSDEQFAIDFPVYSEQQREIMLEFWNKDLDFRKKYSEALQSAISDFEAAYFSDDKTLLENLLNKALDLKATVLIKAKEKQQYKRKMQKTAQPVQPPQKTAPPVKENAVQGLDLSSSNTVNKLYRRLEFDGMKLFPDAFKYAFIEFIMKKTDQQTRKEVVALSLGDAHKLLSSDESELKAILNKLVDKREELNTLFNSTYPLTAKTNDLVFNKLLYDLTNDPLVFKFERGDAMHYVKEHNLEADVLKNHVRLNADMKKYQTTCSAKELDNFCHVDFDTNLIICINQGFKYYPEYSEYLRKIAYVLDLNHQDPNTYKVFLKNYNAAIKTYNNKKIDKNAKDVIMEHIIVDYIYWLVNRGTNSLVNYISGKKTADKSVNRFDKSYNPDWSSESSLKEGFMHYLHQHETKYWPEDIEDEFLNYSTEYKYINKDVLTFFFAAKFDKYNPILQKLSEKEKKVAAEVVKSLNSMLHADFEKKSPQKFNAVTAAIKQVLFNLTRDPSVFNRAASEIPHFIKSKHMEKRLLGQKQEISCLYDRYLEPLTPEILENFNAEVFLPKLQEILEENPKYTTVSNIQDFKKVEEYVVMSLEESDEQTTGLLKKYLKDKSAFISLLNDDSISDDAKDRLLERLVIDFEHSISKVIDKNFYIVS